MLIPLFSLYMLVHVFYNVLQLVLNLITESFGIWFLCWPGGHKTNVYETAQRQWRWKRKIQLKRASQIFIMSDLLLFLLGVVVVVVGCCCCCCCLVGVLLISARKSAAVFCLRVFYEFRMHNNNNNNHHHIRQAGSL